MRFKNLMLLCSIVAAIACLWALPSWSQGATTTPKLSLLDGSRFEVTGGVLQYYESQFTHNLMDVSPTNMGFAQGQWTFAENFSVVAQWARNVNGGRDGRKDRAFIGVGFTLPFGGGRR